jgi:5-methylcytosine-specific restriction endonuclease McrA
LPKDEFRNFDINTRRIIREKTFNRCEFGHINRCKSNIDEIDHFFPFSKGGASTLQNAVGSCKYHNRRKGAYFPVLIYFIIKHRRKKYYKNGSVHLGQFCFSENFKKREKERDV